MNAVLIAALLAIGQSPINDDDWTPRPAKPGSEPWQMQTERDWIDKRFQKMDTGPFLNCSLEYPHGIQAIRVTRATAIKVGDKGEATMIFDRNLMRWAAGWTGGFLDLSDRRFGLLNVALPGGQMAFSTPPIAGWNGEGKPPASTTRPLPRDQAEYKGLILNDKRVVLLYDVQGVMMSEWPWYQRIGEFDVLIRNIKMDRHDKPLTFVAQHFADPMEIEQFDAGESRGAVCLPKGDAETIRFVALVGSHDASLKFDADQQSGTLRGVTTPNNKDKRYYRLMYVHGPRRALPDFFRASYVCIA